VSSFGNNLSGYFMCDLPVVKISRECVASPEQSKFSGRIVTFSLRTDMFWDGISSRPEETGTLLSSDCLVCGNI